MNQIECQRNDRKKLVHIYARFGWGYFHDRDHSCVLMGNSRLEFRAHAKEVIELGSPFGNIFVMREILENWFDATRTDAI